MSNRTTLVVSTYKSKKWGTVLASGNTLYVLKPSSTACTAACLKIWPALLVPSGGKGATAGTGVKQSRLGTVKLSSGRLQVTYVGKRLYYFSGDKAHGQINGNLKDKWGTWSVVVLVKPSSPPPTTTTIGGGGF